MRSSKPRRAPQACGVPSRYGTNPACRGVVGYAFWLDGESLRPLWSLPLQQFLYRQLMYLVIIESTVSAIQGIRSGWRHLPRTGDVIVGAEIG